MKKTHQHGDYRYWYDRATMTWRAAKFLPKGKQRTNALVAKTKQEIIEEIEKNA